ncbi:odorant receptor 94b-like isoform X1 [Cydia amplana]|uniref:odorant receptor 94b-like isoform X1 n=1 Tax=Cydia amplana TaxID=1869771 RepID=UPI002FE58F63
MAEYEGELLSYLSLVPHLKVLRSCGIFPLDSSSSNLKKIFHGFYICISFSLIMLYTLLQIIHVFQVRTDIEKVMDAMFLLLTFLDCIFKQVMFMKKPHKILEMLNIMKGPSFNQGLDEHRPLLVRTINHAQFLLRLFNTLCIVTCFLWITLPVYLHLKNETVEFTIWVPFDTNEKSKFYIVICYVWMQTTWLGLNNSTMDIFIVYLFAQIKTQICILRLNLENLVTRCQEETKTTSHSFTEHLEWRFRGIIYHYNQIIKFSKINEEIFSSPILFQFLVSGWIICTTAYRTINMNPLSGEFVSMILYMICILSEIFLFCFYGNEVAHESQRLMESAYCMQWEDMPVKYRQYLIIFMERIKCSILPKAGKIVPLSINTFVQIVKTSYTFYTFLSNSNAN